jgi:protoheme IX farnesyltransferase
MVAAGRELRDGRMNLCGFCSDVDPGEESVLHHRDTSEGAAVRAAISARVGPAVEVAPRGTLASLVEACKPGIVRLVTITSMVGFAMAAVGRSWELLVLGRLALVTMVGTALSAAGANAINQWMERERDGVMARTSRRPLPQKRVTPAGVLWFGVLLSVLGVALLWVGAGGVAAIISGTCVVVYVLAYTPMKTWTTTSTFVGAIPGALPPLIGWCAASPLSGLETLRVGGGWSLFVLMFVWQIPHFLAIAWMYKDDYVKGGFCVLPATLGGELKTSRAIGIWTALLIPATLMPAMAMPGRLGMVYVAAALVTGLGFAWMVVRLLKTQDRAAARRVFFASIAHLPILMMVMVGEAIARVLM